MEATHVRDFIQNTGYEKNKSVPDDMKFFNRLRAVHRRAMEKIRQVESVDNVGEQDYRELHRYVRAKFGQGKAWAAQFLVAVMQDIEINLRAQEEAMARVAEQHEEEE